MKGVERTKLARKRTALAQERTVLAYYRTAAALILFGLGFLGFGMNYTVLVYTGWTALVLGVFFVFVALYRTFRHQTELKKVKRVLKRK